MIEKVYNEILCRKPDTRDINYYKYSTLNEEQIKKQLLASAEHKDMIQKGREYEKLKDRSEQLETRVRMLEGQISDHVEEFRELSNLLQEKNRYIQELRTGQVQPLPQPKDGPILAEDAAQPLIVDAPTEQSQQPNASAPQPPQTEQQPSQPNLPEHPQPEKPHFISPSESPEFEPPQDQSEKHPSTSDSPDSQDSQEQPTLKDNSQFDPAQPTSDTQSFDPEQQTTENNPSNGSPQSGPVFTSDSDAQIPPPPTFRPENSDNTAPPGSVPPQETGGLTRLVKSLFSSFF